MCSVMLVFAFSMSLVINIVEKTISNKDSYEIAKDNEENLLTENVE